MNSEELIAISKDEDEGGLWAVLAIVCKTNEFVRVCYVKQLFYKDCLGTLRNEETV